MKKENNLPWFCCGDFNEILFNYEKEGGPPRVERCMVDFRKALEDCDLHDLGFTGDPFTWRNNHHVAQVTKGKDWTGRWLTVLGVIISPWLR